MMRVLMLVPSMLKTGIDDAVADGTHPTMDYHALAHCLRSGGDSVDMLGFGELDACAHPLVRWVRRRAGDDVALAVMGFLRLRGVDAVFTNSESVGIPLALLTALLPRRPRHVTIAHRLSTGKKRLFFERLKVHRWIDCFLVYADIQRRFAVERLGVPTDRVAHIDFHADTAFFKPLDGVDRDPALVSAAGLEWRDYPTLIAAAEALPDLDFRLAAASPWSKHVDETQKRPLPGNVDTRRYGYDALRTLYARSNAVAVPLHDNDFQAGITSMLEAMAMGKAVVVTRTEGQTDVVIDGTTGLYVAPGDAEGWISALTRLRDDRELRERLGRNARAWVTANASLALWADRVAGALRGENPRRDPVLVEDAAREVPCRS
ncbi:MAG: glycosyltransferase family 4 protein [Armatimonadota bacterium]